MQEETGEQGGKLAGIRAEIKELKGAKEGTPGIRAWGAAAQDAPYRHGGPGRGDPGGAAGSLQRCAPSDPFRAGAWGEEGILRRGP